jgi:hypothetical protein
MQAFIGAVVYIFLRNHMPSRRLLHPRLSPTYKKPKPPLSRMAQPTDPAPPTWPSYTGTSLYVGTSAQSGVQIFVDQSLGSLGEQNAQDLLADADRVVAANTTIFGTPVGPTQVIVFALGGQTDGTGGADHMGCDFVSGGAIEVCASFGHSMRVSALFEAELSECSMGNNLCGLSTGEALSRWCASVVSNNAMSDFATAPTWFNDGMPNFVDTTDPTDGNPDSTGCGMAFISWLQSLGYTLPQIAQGMVAMGDGGTLCGLYRNLTGDDGANAWPKFSAAVQALPGGVATDDPFGGVVAPVPVPAPPPSPSVDSALTLNDVILLLQQNWPSA